MVPYKDKEMTCFRRSWPWWRWVLTGFSILALALSAYMSWHYLAGGSVIGCGGGSSCDQVLSSRWATIGGILPVSGLAAGVYLAMIVSSLFIGPSEDAPVRRLAWSAMLVIVGAAAGSAVWFTIVQKWFIGAFCPYCMTAHITGILLAVLVIWKAPGQIEDDSTISRRIIGFFPALGLSLAGIAFSGIMAISQVVFIPPPAYHSGQSQENLPAIDPNAIPLVGSPDAQYVVTLLFDYKCPHCQQLHFMLNEAVRRYNGKLAFALCPAPLDKKCNPYVFSEAEQYKDSCELVKIGMAVWVANREVFPAFENWMFSFESGDRWRPRSLDDTRAKAVEMVGQTNFDAAWANPWIDQYIAACVKIYGQTIQNGKGGIPKLVFGSRWVIPELYSADDLIMILQNSLAVPMP
ncbi:MAG: thioredoxin domain-containing protein [Sedimentisphaerales bacterium]|nr:thioredoxin domain-containing protein [Sedimentisphaerales bacterium]